MVPGVARSIVKVIERHFDTCFGHMFLCLFKIRFETIYANPFSILPGFQKHANLRSLTPLPTRAMGRNGTQNAPNGNTNC